MSCLLLVSVYLCGSYCLLWSSCCLPSLRPIQQVLPTFISLWTLLYYSASWTHIHPLSCGPTFTYLDPHPPTHIWTHITSTHLDPHYLHTSGPTPPSTLLDPLFHIFLDPQTMKSSNLEKVLAKMNQVQVHSASSANCLLSSLWTPLPTLHGTLTLGPHLT